MSPKIEFTFVLSEEPVQFMFKLKQLVVIKNGFKWRGCCVLFVVSGKQTHRTKRTVHRKHLSHFGENLFGFGKKKNCWILPDSSVEKNTKRNKYFPFRPEIIKDFFT